MSFEPLYSTELGNAFCADSLKFLPTLPDQSVDLVLTSPPYALHFKKEYGNADQQEYVAWFLPFAREIKRVLKPEGSFVLNVGGAWTPGAPVRSLYHFRLLLALCDELGFNLCQEFFWYIGGLQKYIPAAMALFAPYVNSYRRLVRSNAAPINIQWGTDNRTVGIRSPVASASARRIENRVIGADANPYVALAATLACGYLGMMNRIEPSAECKGDAYLGDFQLPRSLGEALTLLRDEADLAAVLGKAFITVYTEVKEIEYAEFMKVISPWEREHLLLHV